MARHPLLSALIVLPAALLGAGPALAQFGDIFSNFPRPPWEIPNRQKQPPGPPPSQQEQPVQRDPGYRGGAPTRESGYGQPPGGIQSQPLPPPPGTAAAPPGTLPRPGVPG